VPRATKAYKAEINRLHGDQCVNKSMIIALQMAKRYRVMPSAETLMQDFCMSRATAFRWRAAWQYVFNDANAA